MPIYEYQCQACEAVVEELQKISDAPLKKCPECGKNKLEKLVSAPSFRLSGTGWYETDFKSDKDKQRNLSTKDSEKKPDTKSSDKKASEKNGSKGEGKNKTDSKKADTKSSSKKSTKAKTK